MIIETITPHVATVISSGETFTLSEFIKYGAANEYIYFTHYNFFYSYPEFGKAWPNGEPCEFHRVNTQCDLCNAIPERNYAGVGSINLLHNGVDAKAHSSRMILLCNKCCAGLYSPYNLSVNHKTKQISLF